MSSIVQKIATLEASYRLAADWMRQTGAGVEAQGGGFRTYLLKLCPFYDELHQVFGAKVNANPPYLNDDPSDEEMEVGDLESIEPSDETPSVTTKRKELAPTTATEIVRNLKKKQ